VIGRLRDLIPADREGRRRLVGLLAAILAVQAVYWLGVLPLFHAPSPPATLYPILSVEAARLSSPDAAGLATARFAPARFVWTGCCEPAYHAVRLRVRIDQPTPEGAAMTPSVQADNARVYLNGALIQGQGRMTLPRPTVERLRTLWFLPPAQLVAGVNTIDIVTVRAFHPYTDVTPARVGPWTEMKAAYGFREFLFDEYSWISITISGLIGLGALLLYWRGGRRPAWLWLALLTLSWSFHIGLAFWSEFPLPGHGRLFVRPAAATLIGLSWAAFANEWGERPVRLLRWLLPGLGGLAISAEGLALVLLPAPDGYDLQSGIFWVSGLVFAAFAIGLLLRFSVTAGGRRPFETALFVLLAVLLGVQALGSLQVVSFSDPLEFTAPLVLLALAAAFLSRNLRLFRSMEEYNQALARDLAAREREIAEAFEQRKAVERQQALLTERQRIMRDMHDGLGGRLMSLAAQLRADEAVAPREALAAEVIDALEELRLIVDSLDTAGDDLGMALGAFRARMEARLAAAGIESRWSIDDAAAARSLPASAVLDVYRILQEACANMLRHAAADRVEVRLAEEPDGGLVLEFADNGRGPTGAGGGQGGGRGLDNMRRRAARLGGEISFEPAEPGFRVRLRLPPSDRDPRESP